MISMRRTALFLLVAFAASLSFAQPARAFTSDEAVLVDSAIDGSLIADTDDPVALRSLVAAQLEYAVGPLNVTRANALFEGLVFESVAATPSADGFVVSYRVKLPLAWAGTAMPATRTFTLPARVSEQAQVDFATKYGPTCADDESGGIGPNDARRFFLFYRPEQPSCVLDAGDVVTVTASLAQAKSEAHDTYPEYDRLWDDGVLEVVAIFSQDDESGDGLAAYQAFQQRVATYPSSRNVVFHSRLVSARLADESSDFDEWFDLVTPSADLIVYNGHAGVGENVRTLATKGTFRPGKYVIWAMNACDTVAYVDRTLADRRAVLNPDDPLGTKYMDRITNVMPGTFGTGASFTMALVDAAVDGTRSYHAILRGLDPAQVAVVTGDEDNVFIPKPADPAKPSTPTVTTTGGTPAAAPPKEDPSAPSRGDITHGCSAGGLPSGDGSWLVLTLVAAALSIGRRRRPHVLLRSDADAGNPALRMP